MTDYFKLIIHKYKIISNSYRKLLKSLVKMLDFLYLFIIPKDRKGI